MTTIVEFMGGALETTLTGNLTLNRKFRVQVITPDVAGRVIKLPNATDLPEGGPYFYLINKGSDTLEIQDFDATQLVAALAQDKALTIGLAAAGTSAGVWVLRETSAVSSPAPSLRVLGFVFGGVGASAAKLTGTEAYDVPPDSWATKQVMLQHLTKMGGFTVTDLGHSLAGLDTSSVRTRTTDQYSRTTDIWTNKTDLPANGRERCAGELIAGKGYLAGGLDTTSLSIDDMEEYTESGDSWAEKTNMTNNRRQHGFFAISNDGFIIAGIVVSTTSTDLDKYSQSGDSYSSAASIPTPARRDFADFVVSSKGYIACGENTTGDPRMRDLVEYVPDTWTARTAAPVPKRHLIRGFAIGTKGYIQGGRSTPPLTINTQHDEYNPSTDSWSTLAAMAVAKHQNGTFATK